MKDDEDPTTPQHSTTLHYTVQCTTHHTTLAILNYTVLNDLAQRPPRFQPDSNVSTTTPYQRNSHANNRLQSIIIILIIPTTTARQGQYQTRRETIPALRLTSWTVPRALQPKPKTPNPLTLALALALALALHTVATNLLILLILRVLLRPLSSPSKPPQTLPLLQSIKPVRFA